MKITVLLVEDDSEIRAVLAELLAFDDIETVEVANGAEAWETLTSGRHRGLRLILSDTVMPRMNGFQLLDKIRNDDRFRNLPMILTSGNAERVKSEVQVDGVRVEPNAYFPKPFDFRLLTATILELVAKET